MLRLVITFFLFTMIAHSLPTTGELMAEDTERDVYEDFRQIREWSPKEKLAKEKDTLGKIQMVDVDPSKNIYRRNYKRADNINYLDGDIESQMGGTIEKVDENSDKDKSKIDI